MFSGWPATHADIAAQLTFNRTVAEDIANHFRTDGTSTATLLGASGVGKTTAARQALQRLMRDSYICWEHKTELALIVDEWAAVAAMCRATNRSAILMIDDAHAHLYEINQLTDRLAAEKNFHLKLLLVATRHQWNPRIKSPVLYRHGREFSLVQLSGEEIERLLQLVDMCPPIRNLVEPTFSGFSRIERRRRLFERCGADMFVCLKAIFATDSFDDIILREYAGLEVPYQDIYRHVAAMETAGIRVHRQLLIRLLRIPAASIAAALEHLTEIVSEYEIDSKEGIYGWSTRHPVIAGIITRFKYNDIDKIIDLFDRVISNLNPTYEIEIRTIREICNIASGIPRIPDKEIQNRLLRKMMSVAPFERVPRHRLIRNLVEAGAYVQAETEIRVFEGDFKSDGPIYRYKIALMVARATRTPGIQEEDRIHILGEGRSIALAGIARFPHHKSILAAYAELGVEYYKRTKSHEYFDEAITLLKNAEERAGDPDISKIISRYMRRFKGQPTDLVDDDA